MLLKTLTLSTALLLIMAFQGLTQTETYPLNPPEMENKNWHPEHHFEIPDLNIYLTSGYQYYNRYDQNILFGAGAELAFNDHWSANYRIQFGPDYLHFPLSLPVGLLLGLVGSGMNAWPVTKYIFLIPEGVSYSFDLLPGLLVKPYINPLGVTVLGYTDSQNYKNYEVYLMGSAGGQLQLSAFDRWGITAYSEYRRSWGGGRIGMQTGARVSYSFGLGSNSLRDLFN